MSSLEDTMRYSNSLQSTGGDFQSPSFTQILRSPTATHGDILLSCLTPCPGLQESPGRADPGQRGWRVRPAAQDSANPAHPAARLCTVLCTPPNTDPACLKGHCLHDTESRAERNYRKERSRNS